MHVIPLHLHSHWSLLDGVASVHDIVEFARAAKLPALALTDSNALYGAMDFVSACRSASIVPILGTELNLAGGHSILLLAQNMHGYGNLCRLITQLQASPDREATLVRGVSLNDLALHSDCLIALSGGARGLVDTSLRQGVDEQAEAFACELINLFGQDRFVIELQIIEPRDIEHAKRLQALADRMHLRTVATHDIHYLLPDDAPRYRVLTAMRHNMRLSDLPNLPDLSFPSESEMRRRFADFGAVGRAALESTEWIAEKCRFEFPLGQWHFPSLVTLAPHVAVPWLWRTWPQSVRHSQAGVASRPERSATESKEAVKQSPTTTEIASSRDPLTPSLRDSAHASRALLGMTVDQELWSQALEGAAQRYGEITPAIHARLEKEIDVIEKLGYTPYFLVVADIVRFAREQSVPISPRGSAPSSVVAYCLGIHDVDPIAHNLYFERFLSLERHDPPDIDLDLCSRQRDQVIDYVYRKYGADHVAMVCTYATLRFRYALREVAKVYGLSEKRIGEIANQLPAFWHPGMWKEFVRAKAELIENTDDPLEREMLEMSRSLEGTPHHLSVHPGGIVIAPGPITDLVPLQYATKGLLVTQFDLGGIEKAGLVKIDLLGISALTVIADCIDLIRQQEPGFKIDQIPLDDGATAQTLSTAHSIACFQVESPGMRMTLRELTARNTHDLLVALALYRPGPLQGGLKDAFVRRHLGQESADYLHPALEPILRETYGVILYQEQVLRIAHEVAGFSLGDADTLRRAMSKKSLREMEQLHQQFIFGAQATSEIDANIAQRIWDLMAVFAGYGFPKAHAAGYATVAYRMAFLKTHYPAQFMAARLAVWGGFYRPNVYMSEARRLGLTIKPPHINHSNDVFTLELPKTLWMGLGQVRDLTRVTMKTIIAERPFDSLQDFLIRAQPQFDEAVNLVQAGALDGLCEADAKAMLAQLERERWRGRHSGQLGLLNAPLETSIIEPTPREKFAWERAVLGQWVSVHPLQLVADELAQHRATQSDELGKHIGEEVTVAGVRIAMHRFSSKQESMWLVDMEDGRGIYQVLWSGAVLNRNRPVLASREPVLIRGRVRTDRQGLVLVAGTEILRLE